MVYVIISVAPEHARARKMPVWSQFLMIEHARIFIFEHARARSMLDFFILDAIQPLKIDKFLVKCPGKSSIMKNFSMLEHARAQIWVFKHARACSLLDYFILDATLVRIQSTMNLWSSYSWEKTIFKSRQHFTPWESQSEIQANDISHSRTEIFGTSPRLEKSLLRCTPQLYV